MPTELEMVSTEGSITHTGAPMLITVDVAHAPLLEKVVREVFSRIALQGFDRDNADLGLGFLINFPAQSRQFFHGCRVKHTREIVDVSMRIELLPLFRMGRHGGNEGE
jgi:hypothetical protein